MRFIKISTTITFCILLLTSCQTRSQRKEMQALAETLASQQTEEQIAEKEKQGQAATDSLDAARGYALEETKSSSKEIDYNTAVALAIGFGFLFFGFMIFRFVKGAKKSLKDMSYIKSEAKLKSKEILNNPEMRAKMKVEEKQQLEEMLKMFDKK